MHKSRREYEHKSIVSFDLINVGNDSERLYLIVTQCKDKLQVRSVTVVTDSGYSNESKAANANKAHYSHHAVGKNHHKRGKGFSREKFAYDSKMGEFIPPGQMESLLPVFRRAVAAKKGNKEGWSRGLSYVRGVVESHVGCIEIDSAARRRTNFLIDIHWTQGRTKMRLCCKK